MVGKLMIATAGVALATAAGSASAAPVVFDYTGGFQSFTAPTTGVYHITSAGAQGGGAFGTTALGGLGAMVGGDFTLTQGDMLTILVGGMGGFGGPGDGIAVPPIPGGGGGGSFVYTAVQGTFGVIQRIQQFPPFVLADTFTGYVQLADAGGGGGRGSVSQGYRAGGDGQAYGVGSYPGGPGINATERGQPGAGYISPGIGGGNSPGLGGQGGVFPITTAEFGPDLDGHGGFGGGGAGGGGQTAGGSNGGGGGGGGYSGGSGGNATGLASTGGYSYLADGTPMNADYVRLSGVRAGNGLVTIDFLSAVAAVPEPATWAMMIVGMGMIGATMRRRRKVTTRVSYAA